MARLKRRTRKQPVSATPPLVLRQVEHDPGWQMPWETRPGVTIIAVGESFSDANGFWRSNMVRGYLVIGPGIRIKLGTRSVRKTRVQVIYLDKVAS
jgi:hypothetical protein